MGPGPWPFEPVSWRGLRLVPREGLGQAESKRDEQTRPPSAISLPLIRPNRLLFKKQNTMIIDTLIDWSH